MHARPIESFSLFTINCDNLPRLEELVISLKYQTNPLIYSKHDSNLLCELKVYIAMGPSQLILVFRWRLRHPMTWRIRHVAIRNRGDDPLFRLVPSQVADPRAAVTPQESPPTMEIGLFGLFDCFTWPSRQDVPS